jgi:hypothetical protein
MWRGLTGGAARAETREALKLVKKEGALAEAKAAEEEAAQQLAELKRENEFLKGETKALHQKRKDRRAESCGGGRGR